MTKFNTALLWVFTFVISQTAWGASALSASASAGTAAVDDSDLSGDRGLLRPASFVASSLLRPSEVTRTELPSGLELEVVLKKANGERTPVEGLTFFSGDIELRTDAAGVARVGECAPRSQLRLQGVLRDSHFSVSDGTTQYRLETAVDCGIRVTLIFNEESDGGQPLGIWNVAYKGKQKLQQSIGLSFWNRSVPFIWPANGDYYSGGRVHVTRGDHWDVVGHEMGHAIYDLGRLGAFGGGAHKIDECYTEALALSEGWASYFSAWVQISLQDSDARFEYLVPRRAPIRIENIPLDVCAGPTNEWRVTGFLWDLIDQAQDGEALEATFAQLWLALQGTRTSGARSAATLFERAGLSRELLNPIWEQNFRTPGSIR
jgi:hypothetical protein